VAIAFYISGHGFGHASREVEILNALGPGHDIVIRSAVVPGLLARTLRIAYRLLPGVCDTGIVQSSSIAHDDGATVAAARAFYATYAERLEDEVTRLAPLGIRLVVSDIPPLAMSVADRLGVPSVAVANFTWDWIYETHPGFVDGAPGVIEAIRSAYGRAALALELPFAAGFDLFPRVRPIPLVARRPTQSRRVTRSHFGLPANGRIALLSFGGYGMPTLDLAALDCQPEWTIVTTDRSTQTPSPAAIVLPEEAFTGQVRYEDLVAAVDVIVTKPGYGIIAECISAGTPMLYTSRGVFREYDLLVAAMPRVLRCRFISPEDLFAGRWRDALDEVVSLPEPPETMPVNGAEVAAAILRDLETSGGTS
jgi:L-arabinokinase